jgi:hypothetical protein
MTIGIIMTLILFTIFMSRFVGFCNDQNKLESNIEKYDRKQKLKKYKQSIKNK